LVIPSPHDPMLLAADGDEAAGLLP
jgi:hypothetical protein